MQQDRVETITPDPVAITFRTQALTLLTVPAPRLDRKQKLATQKLNEELRTLNLNKWEEAGLTLANRPGATSGSTQGKANSFKITVAPNAELRRYRVEFPEINNRIPTKRETRRELIELMLLDHKPTLDPKLWVADYHTYIISAGRLYDAIGDIAGESELDLPHRRFHHDKLTDARIASKIVYEGKVNLSSLDAPRPSNFIELGPHLSPWRRSQELEHYILVLTP